MASTSPCNPENNEHDRCCAATREIVCPHTEMVDNLGNPTGRLCADIYLDKVRADLGDGRLWVSVYDVLGDDSLFSTGLYRTLGGALTSNANQLNELPDGMWSSIVAAVEGASETTPTSDPQAALLAWFGSFEVDRDDHGHLTSITLGGSEETLTLTLMSPLP